MVAGAPQTASSLQNLPPELLRRIWHALGGDEGLRCASKAINNTVTSFISSTHLVARKTSEADLAHDEETKLKSMLQQLACFPAKAVLTHLHWEHEARPSMFWEYDACVSLLIDFMVLSRDRLAALKHCRIYDPWEWTYGEAACLADTCPHLEQLELVSPTLVGPVFVHFSRLHKLTNLTLENTDVGGNARNRLLASLTQLSGLTSLTLHDDRTPDPETELPNVNYVAYVESLPYIAAMTGLRALDLQLISSLGPESDDADEQGMVAKCIGALPHLTRLAVRNNYLPIASCPFACSTCLIDLNVEDSYLDPADVQVLAAMPRLTILQAASLTASSDLSGMQCAWRSLSLRYCPGPKQLSWLPLSQLNELHLMLGFADQVVQWKLQGVDGIAALCQSLEGASRLLARTWTANGHTKLTLCLEWTVRQLLPDAKVLASLAPLRSRLHKLQLGQHWDVDAKLAAALAEHLPWLHTLGLSPLKPRFGTFLDALVSMPWLDCLQLLPVESDISSSELQAALLRAAAGRGVRARSLTIEDGGCIPDAARQAINHSPASNKSGIKVVC